ncbi:MAG: prephenate dehydrogenase [Dehalococcoidia bacterium]|nr:MAG: prephenate dehydrogenase [Dehalococcoidia bacterium]
MRVAVIGGAGKMGQWITHFLLKEGKEVIITDRDEKKLPAIKQPGITVASNADAVKSADAILVSVPITSFQEVIAEIAPHIPPKQVVVDITSVKVSPVETMHKYLKTALVLGAHPMFGPGASSLKNQNIVLTPTNQDETMLAQKIKRYLETKDARVTLMSPQEHDEMVAVVLGLTHFIAIVSADTLLSLDRLEQMRNIAGTTYKMLLTLVEGVVSRDPEFYASLQMSLPHMANIEELFQKTAQSWADLVKNKDEPEFIHRMSRLKDRLEKEEPDFVRAYQNMYRIIEGL